MSVPWQASAWAEASEEHGVLVVSICGELDMDSREAIETALIAAVTSAPVVTVDLHALTFCDSSGLAMFVAAHQKAAAEGTEFAVRDLRPSIRHLFEISGIDQVVSVIE